MDDRIAEDADLRALLSILDPRSSILDPKARDHLRRLLIREASLPGNDKGRSGRGRNISPRQKKIQGGGGRRGGFRHGIHRWSGG